MKKKLYLLFGLVMSLLLVGIVKAEGPYFLDWKTQTFEDRMATISEPYKDGYITVDYGFGKTYATIYNVKGEEQLKKTFNNQAVVEVDIDGENIYMLATDLTTEKWYLRLYNDKLEQQKEIEVIEPYLYRRGNSRTLFIQEDKLVYLGLDNGPKKQLIKKDLSQLNTESISGTSLTNLAPILNSDYVLESSNIKDIDAVDASDYKDGKYAYGLEIFDTSCESVNRGEADGENPPTTTGRCYFVKLAVADKDGKVDFIVELPFDYYTIYEVAFADDYILVSAPDNRDNYAILVYDLKGKLIQTIKTDDMPSNIIDTPNGFIASVGHCDVSPSTSKWRSSGPHSSQKETGPACEVKHVAYYTNKKIDTKVTDGKGKVEVAGEQRPGEPVTFVVTPDEGYVIGVIKVTDEAGNVITFTKDELKGNTFTMPTANVTIEVEFLVDNAKTADIAIIAIAIIAIISASIVFINNKKILKAK